MEEETKCPDETGDACPCKRQRVTGTAEESESARMKSDTTSSSQCTEGSQTDLPFSSDLHIASNLNLGDDLNLGGDSDDLCFRSSFDGETGETSSNPISQHCQNDILRPSQMKGHHHGNSAALSLFHPAVELDSNMAAVAENGYIQSAEKSAYSSEPGKRSGNSTRNGSSPGGVRYPPERMSDTGFIDLFSSNYTPSHLQYRPRQPGAPPRTVPVSTQFCSLEDQLSTSHSKDEPASTSSEGKPRNLLFPLDGSDGVTRTCAGIHINSLPLSVLLHVFHFFSVCTLLRRTSLVCKSWYNLSRDPDLWRNLVLRSQHRLNDGTLKELVLFSDRVLHVDLTDCRFVTDVGIRGVLTTCYHLQTLKLMRCYEVTDESFVGFGSRRLCPNLRTLHLDHCYHISDRSVCEIAEGCPALTELHLNQCTRVSDVGVRAITRRCRGLKQLLLDHCDKVTDRSVSELAEALPELQYLNVMCCGLSDQGVMEFAKLKNLRNLDLSNLHRLTPAAVIHVAQSCKQLECVNISLNVVMNDECVSAIARNCKNLKRLYCVSCNITDKGLEEIAKYRPTLEALDVGWCQDITDEGVRVISHACHNLGYLGLIRCDRITIETVEELVLKYPHINYSTFILESQRLIERARREGFRFAVAGDEVTSP